MHSVPLCAQIVDLVYDGDIIQKTEIVSIKGSEYISLKAVANQLRGTMQWYPIAGKVTLQLRNQKIEFSLDSRTVIVGSKKTQMTAPLRQVKKTLYAPLEFLLSSIFQDVTKCKIGWRSAGLTLAADPQATLFSPRI